MPLAVIVIRRAAERAERAIQLPVAEDRLRQTLVAAGALPRERIREADLEVMGAVEAGQRPVAVLLERVLPGQTGPPIVVRLVHRLAERVGALEHEALRERLVERDLAASCTRVSSRWPHDWIAFVRLNGAGKYGRLCAPPP